MFRLMDALVSFRSRGGRDLPEEAGYGPDPVLPEPAYQTLPTVRVAAAIGWKPGEAPTPAPGFGVTAFATGLDHPRWLYEAPNGDVLVAESNAPAGRPASGFIHWARGVVMKRAGAGAASANRITLLRDADGDGVAEIRTPLLENLNAPFGMAVIGGDLYVANADALVRYPYTPGQTRIDAAPVRVAPLPAGRNHHWTKSLVASADGATLYVGVGSNSNVGENGMEEEVDRAAVLEIDRATGARRVFASGLRNPVGMDWNPADGVLWAAVNERDQIGDDLAPDYMTSLRRDGFYGWPYSYFGQHPDKRPQPPRPDLIARAIRPDYALGAHSASLGLAFEKTGRFAPGYEGGVFIGQHGSWNRARRVGYRVIFVPFRQGRPSGPPQVVLSGFLDVRGRARGRPVGVLVDRRGGLLVADDVGNAVWRVAAAR